MLHNNDLSLQLFGVYFPWKRDVNFKFFPNFSINVSYINKVNLTKFTFKKLMRNPVPKIFRSGHRVGPLGQTASDISWHSNVLVRKVVTNYKSRGL